MKKTYIKPEMEIEVLELENMIADLGMEGKDRGESLWNGLW